MTNEQLRQRVSQIKRKPSRFVVEGMEQTLSNLPKHKVRSLQDKVLMISSIAAAVAVFAVFAGPPIVAAAEALIERLFVDRAQRYEQQLALPDEEKMAQSVTDQERFGQENLIDVRGEFFGTGVRIYRVSAAADNGYDTENTQGTLSLALIYDQIPVIDPSYVDFVLLMDGHEIPMIESEYLAEYRTRGVRALTEAQWAEGDYGGERAGTNSMMDYVEQSGQLMPTTYLTFQIDPWRIERRTDMKLQASVDGQTYGLAFAFDPEQAHELAVRSAQESAGLAEEYDSRRLEQYKALEASAVPVGISGSGEGLDYTITEISVADDTLTLSYSVTGIKAKNPHDVDFWLDDLYIDGYLTAFGFSDAELAGGTYNGIRSYPLGRDPRKLPEESLIVPDMILRLEPRANARLAFRYNWQTKAVTLPRSESEMTAWIEESQALTASLYQDMSEDHGTAFAFEGGEARVDGASLRITGAELNPATIYITGEVQFDGVTLNEDQWRDLWNRCREDDLRIWVDGLEADAEHNLILNPTYIKPNEFSINCPPPLNSAEIYSDTPIKLRLHLSMPEVGIDETFETEFFMQRPRS